MQSKFNISQSQVWSGTLGNNYILRNPATDQNIEIRIPFWNKLLNDKCGNVKNILEVGANIGINLRAIEKVDDSIDLFCVEPNEEAISILARDKVLKEENILKSTANKIDHKDSFFDLVFTCGVLIHIENENLIKSLKEIFRVSKKYILCLEYFSDKEEIIDYNQGNALLVKRDYGSIYLDNFPELKVVDYGFLWKRTELIDNVTWWLFEK